MASAGLLPAALLLLVLLSGAEAVVDTVDNVDRLEPVVRHSIDTMNEGDQFGFAVVMHQNPPVTPADSVAQAAAKTK